MLITCLFDEPWNQKCKHVYTGTLTGHAHRGGAVECDPDKRSPAIVKGSMRSFHKAMDSRRGDATVIDMRNGWYRIVYPPQIKEHFLHEKPFCVVEYQEFSDGWGKPAESHLFFYLRVDQKTCADVDQLARDAQKYYPFDWIRDKHIVCDSWDIDLCMSAVEIYRELSKRVQAGHLNDEMVDIIGYSSFSSRRQQLAMAESLQYRFAPDQIPEIYVAEYRNMDRVFCVRYEKLALVCSQDKEPIRVTLYQVWRD